LFGRRKARARRLDNRPHKRRPFVRLRRLPPSFATPPKKLLWRHAVSPCNLGNHRARRQRGFDRARLLVIRPSAATAPATGDHLNAPRRSGLRVKRNIKSRHKPISIPGHQTRRSASQIEGAARTPLTNRHEIEQKVRDLAGEILNDRDAVIAFVSNPSLPATNNDAERALRHAVIARRISFRTRTDEGSRFYAASLSIIDTCRKRGVDPWAYACRLIAAARADLTLPAIPAAV
jgi:Transposase IS66 family